MLSKIHTAGLLGINAFHVCCETDIGDGLPGIILIGSLSGEVKEAADRVKTAIKNAKYSFPPQKLKKKVVAMIYLLPYQYLRHLEQ